MSIRVAAALLVISCLFGQACGFVTDDRKVPSNVPSDSSSVVAPSRPSTSRPSTTGRPSTPNVTSDSSAPPETTSPSPTETPTPRVEDLTGSTTFEQNREACTTVHAIVSSVHDYLELSDHTSPADALAMTNTFLERVERLQLLVVAETRPDIEALAGQIRQFALEQEQHPTSSEFRAAGARFFRAIGPIVDRALKPISLACPVVPGAIWLNVAPPQWWEFVAQQIENTR